MSEQKPEEKPNDNLIPKAELDKALGEKTAELSKLKEELEGARNQLLDPEYLEYRQKLREKKPAQEAAKPTGNPETDALLGRIAQLEKTIQNITYVEELRRTQEKYPDFKEGTDVYKQVQDFLSKTDRDYTYEDAYLLVKARDGKLADPAQAAKPFSTEKPSGTIPSSTLEPKEYKTRAEADTATLKFLREKYPALGDTI